MNHLKQPIFFLMVFLFVNATGIANQAQGVAPQAPMTIWLYMLHAALFGIGGILLLVLGYFIWEGLTFSYSIRKQIVEEKNQAVAIVTASFILGMAIIIAASVLMIR